MIKFNYTIVSLEVVHFVQFFLFQAEDGIRDRNVTGVQTCALPIFLCLAVGNGSEKSVNNPTAPTARHKIEFIYRKATCEPSTRGECIMHAQSQEKNPILYASIVYILGFLLFLEWLYPVKEMIQSANLMVLFMYALFCFLLTLTPVRWWASFILKGFGMLLIIHYLFFTEPFLSGLWMNEMFKEITVNVQAIIQRQWYEVTPVFQVGLLLVMIWFMSYLIYYWFVIAKHTVLFVILTFIYLAILDTFTTYDASFAVIRAFVISLISLGITHFMGVIQREVIEIARIRKKPLLFIALVFMVSFSAFI